MSFGILPYELVEMILFTTTALPSSFYGIFDSKSFYSYDKSQEIYWMIEQQRGILRLVCHYWKECIDTRPHRLLHVWDVERWKLPPDLINSANRIILDIPPKSCGCWTPLLRCRCQSANPPAIWLFQPKHAINGWKFGHWDFITDQFTHLPTPPLKASVLQIDGPDLDVTAITSTISQIPNLLHLDISVGTIFSARSDAFSFSKLVSLKIKLTSGIGEGLENLRLQKLSYLSLGWDYSCLWGCKFNSWILPSLRHLQMKFKVPPSVTITDLEVNFASIGSQLESLDLNLRLPISDGFLDLFPNLKKLFICSSSLRELLTIPSSRPLSIIAVTGIDFSFIVQICSWLPRCPGITQVHFDFVWSELLPHLFWCHATVTRATYRQLVKAFGELGRSGVTLLDQNDTVFDGVVYEKMMAFLSTGIEVAVAQSLRQRI